MRLPIILMLLTILLLPADLEGLAQDVQSGFHVATAAAARLLHQNNEVKVAEAPVAPATALVPSGSVTVQAR